MVLSVTVSKLHGVFDVRDWTANYGDGSNDDGATISAVAAWLRAEQGGGVVAVPVPSFLDSRAVIPPGVYLRGNGRNRSELTVGGADVGVHFLGEDLGDLRRAGGGHGFEVVITDPAQGGVLMEGSRELELHDVGVVGIPNNTQGAIYGFRIQGRTDPTPNAGGSAWKHLHNLYAAACAIGLDIDGISQNFANRDFIRSGHSQTCDIGVRLKNANTHHMQWDCQSSRVGYQLEGSQFNLIETIQENTAGMWDIEVLTGSTRNRFYGSWNIDKVIDAGGEFTTNRYSEKFIDWANELHIHKELSRNNGALPVEGNAGAARNLSLDRGSVFDFTLNTDTVFDLVSTTGLSSIERFDALTYMNPTHEFRLILRNPGGNTPDFSAFVTDWAAPGGTQPAWPANTTITNFYTSDGGITWTASPVSGFQ